MSQDFLGISTWLRLAVEGNEITPFAEFLLDKARENEKDHAAVMDLSFVAQLMGNRDWGVALQLDTLNKQQIFAPTETQVNNPRIQVMALNSPGDLKQNTPIDCLFVDSDNSLVHLYMGEGIPFSTKLPEHDLVFVSMMPNESSRAALLALEALVESGDSRPIINHPSRLLALLDNETLSRNLSVLPNIKFAPKLDVKVKIVEGGLVAHYRVILIDGKPMIYQIALANTLTDYISAGMQASSEKQALEQKLMASFDQDFVQGFQEQWRNIYEGLGLDYVGIDCTAGEDGQLIITAIEPSVFVHGFGLSDSTSSKAKAFDAIKSQFHQMLYRKAFPESNLFYRG